MKTLKQIEKKYLTEEQAIKFSPLFKVGDKVTFTNGYGVSFSGKTIVGISAPWGGAHGDRPRYYYAPDDSPWFSVPESSLSLVEI